MILIDDASQTIIESLAARFAQEKPLYDINLMQHGGNLKGWFIKDQDSLLAIASSLHKLKEAMASSQGTTTPLLFAMGDGNHSLATAKANWVKIKARLQSEGKSSAEIMAHPARFALAELVNVHSPGLRFEPIHRAIFTRRPADYVTALRASPGVASMVPCAEAEIRRILEQELAGQTAFGVFDGKEWLLGTLTADCPLLPPAVADKAFEAFKSGEHDDIDFIHGWTDTTRLTGEGAVAIMLPVIARDLLFKRVEKYGPLPRKAFSMGEAEEKRYYVEARRIVP